MNAALAYVALLASLIFMVWIAARRAGRAEKELEYAKKDNQRQRSSGEILNRYINLSSYELSQRVLEKRKAAAKRMRNSDRLD